MNPTLALILSQYLFLFGIWSAPKSKLRHFSIPGPRKSHYRSTKDKTTHLYQLTVKCNHYWSCGLNIISMDVLITCFPEGYPITHTLKETLRKHQDYYHVAFKIFQVTFLRNYSLSWWFCLSFLSRFSAVFIFMEHDELGFYYLFFSWGTSFKETTHHNGYISTIIFVMHVMNEKNLLYKINKCFFF